jgi:hypothetical protein
MQSVVATNHSFKRTVPDFLVPKRFPKDDELARKKLAELKRKLWVSKINDEIKHEFHIPNFPCRSQTGAVESKCNRLKLNAFYKKNTFPNQQKFGKDIVRLFAEDSKKILCLAIAPTQSGKTGSMLSIVRNAMVFKNTATFLANFFVITAHSDKAWVHQTRERFPNVMQNNIWHRNDLLKNAHKIKHIRDAWIIVDEAHIGCKVGQTLYRFLHAVGLFNIQSVLLRNIKIVLFTATPGYLVHDVKSWKLCASVLNMDVPDAYVSVDKLLAQNRVLECKPLCGDDVIEGKNDVNNIQDDVIDNIREIIPFIRRFDAPKFHIVRTPRGAKHSMVIHNFKYVFHVEKFAFISEPKIRNFEDLFMQKPEKHTFVFIKDKLRCAKTLCKNHIGVLYDRHVHNPNHASVVQGLLGRLTGFHANFDSVVFSNYAVSSKNIRKRSIEQSCWMI